MAQRLFSSRQAMEAPTSARDPGAATATAPRAARRDHPARERLLDSIEELELAVDGVASYPDRAALLKATPEEDRLQVIAALSLAGRLAKCRQAGACLACTLKPCACDLLPCLPHLPHRLHLYIHHKEAFKTTNTGKLLLLAHPRAQLLVSGVASHERRLEGVMKRPSACVLYPDDDAKTLSEMQHRVSPAAEPAGADRRNPNEGSGCGRGSDGGEGGTLDIIILDGTWGQTRWLAQRVPPSVPRLTFESDGAALPTVFGRSLRTAGKSREEAQRISTVEAYAMLSPQHERLHQHLAALIEAIKAFSFVDRKSVV